MEKDRIEMSQGEWDRLEVMASVLSGGRTQAEGNSLGGLCPRSLSSSRTMAEPNKRGGHAIAETQPSDVRPANGRSGRTPAELYPPDHEKDTDVKKPWSPLVLCHRSFDRLGAMACALSIAARRDNHAGRCGMVAALRSANHGADHPSIHPSIHV